MGLVPCGGDGPDDGDAAGPRQAPAAFGAALAVPCTVGGLAERGEDLAALVATHRQDAGHVLDDQDPGLPDLAEQATGGVLGSVALGGGGQQRGLRLDRGDADAAGASECLDGLGLGVAGSGDDEQPEGVAVEVLDRGGGHDAVAGVEVVLVAEPAAEHVVRLGQSDRRSQRRLRGCARIWGGEQK